MTGVRLQQYLSLGHLHQQYVGYSFTVPVGIWTESQEIKMEMKILELSSETEF